MPESTHCKNIQENPRIAVSIFDSHQEWGVGVGLQVEADVDVVSLLDSPKAGKIYATRNYPYGGDMFKAAIHFIESLVLKGKSYKIYRIKPITVWMNNPNSDVDERVKIDLSAE